ncbi:MAG: chemotaxis protein CheB [Bacteroidota bacterium]
MQPVPADVQHPQPFFIVGVGASAGGLEALERFFTGMPLDIPAAFVVIQHLSPTHKSLMGELLAKHTRLPIEYAAEGSSIVPGHIYLIPPSKNLLIRQGRLHLYEQERRGHINFPIDLFFESLAYYRTNRAVGVILSGTGSDGTKGIRTIKEQGGLVLVQKPESAKFDGMPRSALATNLVDLVVPPSDMATILNSFTSTSTSTIQETLDQLVEHENSYKQIVDALRRQGGVDFSLYKDTTISRRIQHRMGLLQIMDIDEYAALVRQSEQEARALQREMLIGVTRFFRDGAAFDKLGELVLDNLIERALERPVPTLRLWCVACSTGEEVYSLAMMLVERVRKLDHYLDIKIFATDVDRSALNAASVGVYASSIIADVPKDYLQRYFTKEGDQYQISRELRQRIVFAPHNVLKDPPFSRIDLISCRNLLIYLKQEAQEHTLLQFAYSAARGYVFLGSSESVSEQADYFAPLDSKARIFQVRGHVDAPTYSRQRLSPHLQTVTSLAQANRTSSSPPSSRAELYEEVLEPFMPPSMIIDRNRAITHCFGRVEPFLRVPRGRVDMDVSRAVHPNLRVPLGTALHKVLSDRETVSYQALTLQTDEQEYQFDLHARPVTLTSGHEAALVVFQAPRTAPDYGESTGSGNTVEAQTQQRILDLERKLRYNEESLQAAIEELETSNEELQATNEELMASNEELQSTNEELQSTNEELFSVNSELHAKVVELTRLNVDMDSLLENLEVSTVFLDPELRIRKFTRSASTLISLSSGDVGRPVYHFAHAFHGLDLRKIAEQVMEQSHSHEQMVQSTDGLWYLVRLHPYESVERLFRGVVVMFIDVTDLHEAREALANQAAQIQSITESVDTPLAALDGKLRFTYFNKAYQHVVDSLIGQPLHPGMPFNDVFATLADYPELHEQMNQALTGGSGAMTAVIQPPDSLNAEESSTRYLRFATHPITNEHDQILGITQVIRDVTRQRNETVELKQKADVLGGMYTDSDVAVFMIDVEAGGVFRFSDNNATHERLSGMQKHWLRGRTPEDLAPRLPQDAIEAVRANYQRCLDQNGPIQYEEVIPISGVETGWLTRLTPIKDAEGTITRIIGTSLQLPSASTPTAAHSDEAAEPS